jgi:transposase-like protein
MNKEKKWWWETVNIRKDSSIQLAINSDKSTAKIAVDLNVNEKTLYNWIREYKKANNIAISSDLNRTNHPIKNSLNGSETL